MQYNYAAMQCRLSLASYAWPRRLVLGRITTDWDILATRGLGAGSKFATYEQTGIMLVAFDQMTKLHPAIHVTIMVDDVNLELEDEREPSLIEEFVAAAMHGGGPGRVEIAPGHREEFHPCQQLQLGCEGCTLLE